MLIKPQYSNMHTITNEKKKTSQNINYFSIIYPFVVQRVLFFFFQFGHYYQFIMLLGAELERNEPWQSSCTLIL